MVDINVKDKENECNHKNNSGYEIFDSFEHQNRTALCKS